MRKLRTKSAAGLNAPAQWHRSMRPWFDAERFQQQIDSRVGLNKDGRPIIRLVWGQDIADTAYGQTTPRYWTKRRKVAKSDANIDDKWLYYTVPRWILERRMEPEQYAPAWDAARYSMKDEYGIPVDRGPAPPEYYLFAYLCAEHEAIDGSGWAACCNRAFYTDRSRCWGKYRPPTEFDLMLINQAVRKMESDKGHDSYRPITPAELAELEVMANMQVEREAEQQINLEREMAADFYGLPLSAIPENYGRRESGLVVPN